MMEMQFSHPFTNFSFPGPHLVWTSQKQPGGKKKWARTGERAGWRGFDKNPQGSPSPPFFYPLLSLFSGLVFFARPDQLSLKHTLLKAFFKALKLASNINSVYTKCYDHCIRYILPSFLQINAKYNKWVNLQFRLVNRVGCDSDTLLCVTLTLYFDLQDHNESKGRVKRATKTYNLFCNIPLKRFK